MPIDLKWVRSHPDQVEEWQKIRGLDGVQNVHRLCQADERTRQLLQELNQKRKALKDLSKSLRPKQAAPEDPTRREQLLQERTELQESIHQTESQWKDASRQVQLALWAVASPVDTQLISDEMIPLLPQPKNMSPKSCSFNWDSSPGWDVSRAMLQHTRRFFADRYTSQCLRPSTTSADMVQAMWGVSKTSKKTTVDPPLWLSWLAKQIPKKSIFGGKQLPLHVNLWGDMNGLESLELLAMTAGTLWDSRTMQKKLAEELLDFYQSLVPATVQLKQYVVSPEDLQQHEQGRIVLVAEMSTNSVCQLGWVSNFGDSVSRACELVFAGGGHKDTKDYVHLVHATVLSQDTLANLLRCNVDGVNVELPAAIWPHLGEALREETKLNNAHCIPSDSLTAKNVSQPLAPAKIGHTVDREERTKMPLLSDSRPSKEQIQAEAVSTPFDFLIP